MDFEIAPVFRSCYNSLSKSGVHKSWTNKFCTVASNTCGSSVWILLHVNILVPKILRCLSGSFKNL